MHVEAVKCPPRSAAGVRTFALLIALLLAGCSSPTVANAVVDEEWNLSSRGGRELNFDMEQGGTIRYRVTSSAEVVWDLHSHDDAGGTVIHEEGRGREWSGNFTAPAADTYSIFVRGNGSTSVVRVHVEGPFIVKA